MLSPPVPPPPPTDCAITPMAPSPAVAISPLLSSATVPPVLPTAQSGEYKPLSRPLFVYAKATSLERQEVRDFLTYMLDNATEISEAAQFVPPTDEQLTESRSALEAA